MGHLHTWIRADKAVLHLNLQTLRAILGVLAGAGKVNRELGVGLVVVVLRDIQVMVATVDRGEPMALTATAVAVAAVRVMNMAPMEAVLDSLVKAPMA